MNQDLKMHPGEAIIYTVAKWTLKHKLQASLPVCGLMDSELEKGIGKASILLHDSMYFHLLVYASARAQPLTWSI